MFDADKELGLQTEERVRLLIENKTGFMCLKAPDGEFTGYDLRLDMRGVPDSAYFERRYEVKHDFSASKTGNIAIEISYKGRPSGITKSTADYWVIVVGEMAYFFEAADLRAEVFLEKYVWVKGGDDKASMMVLIPFNRMKNLAKTIHALP